LARGTSVDHVKLFRNIPGLQWSRRIHEQILHELSSRGIIPARLNGAVVHHTHYDSSEIGQARKLARDMALLKLEHAEDPKDPFTLFNLGMTEHHAGNHASAITWLSQALENATPQMTHTRKIYALLACSLRDDDRLDEALTLLTNGLTHFPEDPELHYQAALILNRLNRNDEAIDHLRSYGEDISDHFSSIDMGLLTYKRWSLLGELYAQSSNYLEAKKWFGVCLEREPWYEPAPIGLFEVALAHGDVQTASLALEGMLAAAGGPTTEWAARVCRHAHLVGGGPEAVIQRLGPLIDRFPRTVEPRLMYARVLIDLGRMDVAAPHLRLLAENGCEEAKSLLGIANAE
jgi:tetratricopeptide (TPR) repeat protein